MPRIPFLRNKELTPQLLVACIAKGKALLPWFTSDELEVRARPSIVPASQLLAVALEGSRPAAGNTFPRAYVTLSVDNELKE